MDSNANIQDFFNQLTSEADLKNLVSNKTKEGLYLEFKQKKNAKNGALDNDDKKNFAKALSGFANSDGGVLVWGIQTRAKDESAKSLKPINQVDGFIRSLKSYLSVTTHPIVDGILIEKIEKANSKSRGFVKCLIPVSLKAPHRSSFDREYYKRSVEGFYRLEHFDLEDMFGRRRKPLLKLNINTKQHNSEDKSLYELHFNLRNEGRSVAKYSGLFCKFNNNIEITQTAHPLQDVSTLNNSPCVSFSDNLGVIHPNNISHSVGYVVFRKKDKKQKIIGQVSYYCDNMLLQEVRIEI